MITGTENHEHRSGFQKVGAITASQAALGVSSRTAAIVEALPTSGKAVIWKLGPGGRYAHLAFTTDADADAHVVSVLAQWGEGEDYVRIMTLTLTGGKQLYRGGSRVWVDTIVVSNMATEGPVTVVNSGGDMICRVVFDAFNATKIAFIATTLQASATLRLHGEVVS